MSDHRAPKEPAAKDERSCCDPCQAGTELADLFSALADPAVLSLLEFVLGQDRTVTDCSIHFGVPRSSITRRLDFLTARGYVEACLVDGLRFYRAPSDEMVELLALARSMASDRFSALVECASLNDEASGTCQPD